MGYRNKARWCCAETVRRTSIAAITIVSLLLSACGGGGGGGGPTAPPPPPPPPGPIGTYISGKILDTNAFAANGTELPIVGVTIRFLGEPTEVVSDANGEFVIDNLQAGSKVIDFDTATAAPAPSGDGYAGFREQLDIAAGANVVSRPFYLPRIFAGSLTTVDPLVDIVVTNAAIGVSMTVFAGTARDQNGALFTGQLSISEVPNALAPAALPVDLAPGLLFTVQPVGVTFDTPATLSIRNDRDNWLAGSKINFWSLDPDLGVFAIVGEGAVAGDGSTIETMSGGIRAADWHLPSPDPAVAGDKPKDNDGDCQGDDCCDKSECDVGSKVELSNGRFTETFATPAYASQGRSRALEFVYSSDRAYPVEVMVVAPTIEAATPVPGQISYEGLLAGVDQGFEIFLDTSVLQDNQDQAFRVALPLDATQLATNEYVGQARITSRYPLTSVSGRLFSDYMIVNDISSEFGAGWRLKNFDRIYPVTSGGIMLVDGSGFPRRYVEPNGSGSLVTIVADAPGVTDAAALGLLLDNMGLPYQVRSTGSDFFGSFAQLTNADIVDTALFILLGTSGNAIFSQADITDQEKANVLDVLENAQAQGLPIMIMGQVIEPFDTGFAQNPNCCLQEPELTRYEQLVKLKRTSNDSTISGSGRNWRLVAPAHPIFNGPFGTVVADAQTPFTDVLNTGYSPNPVAQRNAGETLLVEVWSSLSGGALLNDHPIVTYTDPASGALSLSVSVAVTTNLAPDVETLIKNAIDWMMTNITAPGQLVSPAGDYSVVTLLQDGTYTRRTKFGDLYTFNASGYLQTMADRNGNTTSFAYDGSNRVISITDPVGKITQLTYAGARLSTVTDPANRVTQFTHDASGDLTQVMFPDNSTRQFSYDGRHLMGSQTDQRGFVTTYQFNFAGQFTQSTQADGSVRTLRAAQSVGLIDPSSTSSQKPVPVTLMNEGS